MKIATWNVNSIRARLERVLAWLDEAQPDVLCVQETKCEDALFPVEPLRGIGYEACFHGQRTYNGVAILARGEAPLDVATGLLDDNTEDAHARVLGATVRGVRVVSVYAPNGQSVGAPAYAYKLAWYARLHRYLERYPLASTPLALCGDFNVAPDERDVYNPEAWEGSVLVTPPEREALARLGALGLQDTFRLHHQESGVYSWWDYRQLAFPRNQGLRIDHVLASPPLAARSLDAGIDREARKGKLPSDHAPVWATFLEA